MVWWLPARPRHAKNLHKAGACLITLTPPTAQALGTHWGELSCVRAHRRRKGLSQEAVRALLTARELGAGARHPLQKFKSIGPLQHRDSPNVLEIQNKRPQINHC